MSWPAPVNYGNSQTREAEVSCTKPFLSRIPLTVAVILLLSAAARAEHHGHALIIDNGNERYVFKVEIARTPAQRERGLQGRSALASNTGMLFPVHPPAETSMWMADTPIPLDIIFIDTRGRIARIVEQAPPMSRKPINSLTAVSGVLEVSGGTVERLGIKDGDRVVHPALKP